MNKILTLDNLYSFFVEQNKSVNFSTKETGKPIVVSMPANFEVDNNDMQGMLKLKLKVAHIDTNRNGSHISKENMEKAMPSLKYRPLMAYIHTLPDGTEDFYAHNIEIVEDENGDEQIVYTEKQVGCFTADSPYLEYDKDMDKTYVIAYAVVPEDYTSAANIIRRKNGTKVSCELVINELSYNAKEKYLDLTDFYFSATTLLGADEDGNEIGEGMLGARADITDFCHKEPVFNYQDKLIETLEKLNFTLENFNNSEKKGGEKAMNKFEELLAKYNATAEDVTFETEGLSDEELETKFVEVFGKNNNDDTNDGDGTDNGNGEESSDEDDDATTDDGEGNSDPEGDDEPIATDNNACGGKKRHKKCSVDENGDMTVSFEISHEDIRYALYNLLGEYEEADNEWYGIYSVYDDYFVMQGWFNGKFYKQGYAVDGDNVSLDGERIELFQLLLTESEKLAIDKMREEYTVLEAKYNELKTFKDKYDADGLKAQKDAIFAKAEYECLSDNEAFKSLINDADKYSIDEINTKADLIFAAHMKTTMEFSVKPEKKSHVIGINFDKKETKKSPYGNLFTNK